jgi:hypothetical protein
MLMKLHSALYSLNRIGGVMVSVLASSAIDRGFEPRSGKTKDYKIGSCCFSAKHAALMRKSKDGIKTMRSSGATWLSVECCLSELVTIKIQLSELLRWR